MDLNKLKEELKKAKDPRKFLEELLKKTKDEKLKKLIKEILEKRDTRGESKLEATVRASPVRLERREPGLATIEVIEDDMEATRVGVRPDLVVGAKQSEDYGGKVGGKSYKTGSILKQLEESHLVSAEGHLTTAETKGLIDRKLGQYDMNKGEDKYNDDSKYRETPKTEGFVQASEFEEVLTHEERQARKKKRLGDYV
ncbi:MAG: hypothetical protein KKG75_04115 [Nanoarchaeota archaeon]|nr:hypothetical protein [Nanoarchaeota archaeon]